MPSPRQRAEHARAAVPALGVDFSAPWAMHPAQLHTLQQALASGALMDAYATALLADVELDAAPAASFHPQPSAIGAQEQTSAKVAVLPLRGTITPRSSYLSYYTGGRGLTAWREDFLELVRDSSITAIVLDVDSGGGSTSLVAETADIVRAARGTKPIVAVCNPLMASAAYWIGSAADEVVITPSGQVGSIGTVILHWDWSQWNAEYGIKPTFIHADKYKVEGNPEEPLDDEAAAEFQRTVDDFQAMFLAGVAASRGVTPEFVAEQYGEGRVFPAERALAAGLVDSIETLDEVIGRLLGAAPAPPVVQAVDSGDTVVNAEHAAELAVLAPAGDAAASSEPPAPDSQPPAAEAPAPSPTPPASREAATAAVPAWLLPPTTR